MGTSGLVVDAFPLAAGRVREQSSLLVVGVHRAGGDDVIFVLVHQGQLGIVTPWIKVKAKRWREKVRRKREQGNLPEPNKRSFTELK